MNDNKTIMIMRIMAQLKSLEKSTAANMAAVERKRSWRASEKAMALADYQERMRAIYAMRILLADMDQLEELEYTK